MKSLVTRKLKMFLTKKWNTFYSYKENRFSFCLSLFLTIIFFIPDHMEALMFIFPFMGELILGILLCITGYIITNKKWNDKKWCIKFRKLVGLIGVLCLIIYFYLTIFYVLNLSALRFVGVLVWKLSNIF
jgi:hypothetical protein